MTDRPALARLLADEAERRGQPGLVDRLARVLAEHETAPGSATYQRLHAEMRGWKDEVAKWQTRAEAAEARCAQLEQERDKWLKRFNESEQFQSGPREQFAAIQAEHERLRAALRDLIDAIPEPTLDDDPPLRSWVNIAEAALAPSQEPTT